MNKYHCASPLTAPAKLSLPDLHQQRFRPNSKFSTPALRRYGPTEFKTSFEL
jgi:hypothetical protein